MRITVIAIVVAALGTVSKGFGKRTERIGNQRKNRNYPGNSIFEIGYITESWRPEETCFHSDSGESPPVKENIRQE